MGRRWLLTARVVRLDRAFACRSRTVHRLFIYCRAIRTLTEGADVGAVTAEHRDYWEQFYAAPRSTDVPLEASSFATWVEGRLERETLVVDVGCGNARDSLFFAQRGYRVIGLDYARSAVERGRSAAREAGWEHAEFAQLDLYEADAVTRAAAELRARQPVAVYARFLVHAVETEGRHGLWTLAQQASSAGTGQLFMEFRTGKDAHLPHVFGEHYRNYLEPQVVVDEVEALGGTVVHREEGHGLAVYRDEDPHVSRLVVHW
jgi:SAM-dependent methyltransferase